MNTHAERSTDVDARDVDAARRAMATKRAKTAARDDDDVVDATRASEDDDGRGVGGDETNDDGCDDGCYAPLLVRADADASYDDLTGAALTGIEARAIEAEKELVAARTAKSPEKGMGGDARETKLDERKFKQLDALLDQTTIYSQFLSEQMDTLEEEEGGASGRSPNGANGKRGTDGKSTTLGKRKKMSEQEELEATKKMLPLMEGGSMRDYQLKGVKWMISLYQNGLNGILADQMGLGKTVQTIGFLSHLRSKGVLWPYLVIGPLSTLSNWVSEFQRWTPSIPVILYHGTKQERAEKRMQHLPTSTPIKPTFPVIVTSYEVVMADRKFLQKYNFKYLVVDEGHRLKNFDCKLIRELKYIPTANKLLLTGTPLQNNLPELW